jgi:predicted DNA-binding protein
MGYTGFVKMRQTSLRIPADDMKRLETIAKDEGLKIADIVRRAITKYLKK